LGDRRQKTSILLFQKAGTVVAKGDEPRTREVWFYEITDEAFSLDQKRKARCGQDNDLWDALVKFDAWNRYRQGETASKAAAVTTNYHQPDYWEERWRSVDAKCLELLGNRPFTKDHTYSLHELWPQDFPFDPSDKRGAGQYEAAVLARVRPEFTLIYRKLVERTVAYVHAVSPRPDHARARAAAEKKVKAVTAQISRIVREEGLLDRDFGQFGMNALKALLKEIASKTAEWLDAIEEPAKKPSKPPQEPDADLALASLTPLLKEFAKLDGYNVWRRDLDPLPRTGKLTASDEGEPQRVPTLLSWIVPVRQWAELESWGEDPKTKQPIDKPTHKKGDLDPKYFAWLRDTLKVFDDDATVKKDFLDRLDPDCLEALDFNLSAGRHKPFVFDAGQHRPPAALIGELQAIHGEVQKRLGKLLKMVGGGK
jgi:type I restriction enzyme M protein